MLLHLLLYALLLKLLLLLLYVLLLRLLSALLLRMGPLCVKTLLYRRKRGGGLWGCWRSLEWQGGPPRLRPTAVRPLRRQPQDGEAEMGSSKKATVRGSRP